MAAVRESTTKVLVQKSHYVPMDPLVTTTQISIYDDDYDFYADVTDGPGPYDHYDHEDDSTWTVLLYPETTSSPSAASPTVLPIPSPGDIGGGGNEQNYDNKWNVDKDNNPVELDTGVAAQPTTTPPPDKSILEDQNKDAVEQYEGKSLPGTMVLVIGIILGAFVAMILIVIFVLKKRIRVDGNGTVKGDEGLAGSSGPPGAAPGGPPGINHGPPGGAAPRYQFAPPNDYGEMPGGAGPSAPLLPSNPGTATTALMEGGRVPPGGGGPPPRPPMGVGPPPGGPMGSNGFFNNNCGPGPMAGVPAANGASDRSRLFRKTNGSKPVREWYV